MILLSRKRWRLKPKKKNIKIPLQYLSTFSKTITVFWIILWTETVLFSQLATVFNLGDSLSIQYINDNVKEIGVIIAGFYFGKSCLENVAQGIEEHREKMYGIQDDADSDTIEL